MSSGGVPYRKQKIKPRLNGTKVVDESKSSPRSGKNIESLFLKNAKETQEVVLVFEFKR